MYVNKTLFSWGKSLFIKIIESSVLLLFGFTHFLLFKATINMSIFYRFRECIGKGFTLNFFIVSGFKITINASTHP